MSCMSKCPVVLCSIEGRSSNFIVDTGSQVSIIPISLVRKWGLKLIEDKRLSNLRTANGSKLITMGVVQVDAFMWNKKCKDVIFVVTQIDSLCIIGMNILEKFEYVWLGDKETKLKEIIIRKVNRVESNSLDVAYIGLKGVFRKQVEQLITEYKSIFHVKGNSIGLAVGTHRIRTIDEIPVAQPYRRIIKSLVGDVKKQIDEWIEEGVVVKSSSEFVSPLVIVRKSSGEIRLCVDYRKLNKKTIKDAYPIPRIDDSLEALGSAKYFSCIDLKSAYNQIRVDKSDQHKTAFSSPWGLYEFTRMPFGLINAPATFQRMMSNLFRDEMFESVVCYLDDVLVFSPTVESHIEHLKLVLGKLEGAGLKLNIKKCKFCIEQVVFLGYNISNKGISTIKEKTKAIVEWEKPTNLKELRSFLGVCSYYRRFIKGFAKIVSPLNELNRIDKSVGEKRVSRFRSKKVLIGWNKECDQAMEALKDKLVSAPILGIAKYDRPFTVETDASDRGLGAVLSQEIDGKRVVIAYASKSLNKGERNEANYSAKKLEFLAVVWAISDKFRHYLLGSKCQVITDNSAVACILNKKDLSALEQRWIGRLAPFELTFKYRAGKQNIVADALSRKQDSNSEVEDSNNMYEEDLDVRHVEVGGDGVVNEIEIISQMDRESLREKQMQESGLLSIIELLEKGEKVERYKLEGGILYKNSKEGDNILVLPRSLIKEVLEGIHDDNGHQGIERSMARVNLWYTWKGKYEDVRKYVNECEVCSRSKGIVRKPIIRLGSLGASRPLELLFLDFVTLDKSTDNRENVLVMTDAYTKFVRAVPTRDQSAETVAKILLNEWVYDYGIPERIHTDQGRNFQAGLVKEVCNLFGIKQSRSSPYHPKGNGQCERMNRTIISLLRVLSVEEKRKWPKHLQRVVYYYNITKHTTTGYSPFQLMFGREERLPIDRKLSGMANKLEGEWLVDTKNRVLKMNKKIMDAKVVEEENRKLYIEREDILEEGSVVRIKNRVLGRRKLENYWGDELWKVEGRVKGTSAYKIIYGDNTRVENRENIKLVVGNV